MITNKELLPREVWEKYGDLGIRYMDSRIVACIRYIREVLQKPININNATYNERTLRIPGMKSYKTYSDHSYGRAIDFDVVGMDSLDVQRFLLTDIITSMELKQMGLTGIEDGTEGWTHISCADFNGWGFRQVNGIYLIPQ